MPHLFGLRPNLGLKSHIRPEQRTAVGSACCHTKVSFATNRSKFMLFSKIHQIFGNGYIAMVHFLGQYIHCLTEHEGSVGGPVLCIA